MQCGHQGGEDNDQCGHQGGEDNDAMWASGW